MNALIHFIICWLAGVASVGLFAGISIWRDEITRNPDVPLRIGKMVTVVCLIVLPACLLAAWTLYPQPCP